MSMMGILLLLAAVEVAAPTAPGAIVPGRPPALHIASFLPACEVVPPHAVSVYTGQGQPVPRSRFAAVDVFMVGHAPRLRYEVIGEVTVSTQSRNVSLWNLIDSAKAEARKLGGHALIEVWPRPVSPSDPQGPRVLTAKVVNWT
jgi:hypothetical protein